MVFLINHIINILLANEYKDNWELFSKVVDEFPFSIQPGTAYNHEQLRQLHGQVIKLVPNFLFPDIDRSFNFPKKICDFTSVF